MATSDASKTDVLIDQVVDSAIVAGIASLSMLAAQLDLNPIVIGLSFVITFLIKLKDYRGTK